MKLSSLSTQSQAFQLLSAQSEDKTIDKIVHINLSDNGCFSTFIQSSQSCALASNGGLVYSILKFQQDNYIFIYLFIYFVIRPRAGDNTIGL